MEHITRPLPGSRLLMVLVTFIGAFAIIMLRLYFLQIIQADFFAKLAHRQYTTTVTLPAQRGTLFDRYQKPLAVARQKLSAFIDRNTITDTKQVDTLLREHFPLVHQQWQRHSEQSFFWLARHISQKRKQIIATQCPQVHFMFEPSRWYLAPHLPEVTGFTNIDTKGMSGIERASETTLAGKPTTMRSQKEARNSGLYFAEHIITPGTAGTHLSLTIDQHLHFLVQQELTKTITTTKALHACALVMDPTNGQIITMAQAPSYNPNDPTQASAEDRKNHLIGTCHEMGSVITLFSALSALAEGITTPDELINCEGKSAYIDGFKVENEDKVGTIPFWQVFTRSSNVGMAKVCKRLGTLLYDHYNRLGFGTPTGIELPGERSGFVNPPERWSASSPLLLSYGYEVMTTLLQVAKGVCLMANAGFAVVPTLHANKRPVRGLQLYGQEPINQMRDMMQRAAQSYGITLPGYTVMSKAGMAQTLKNGRYSNTDHLYSCAGIIENENYKRVIVVFVQHLAKNKRPSHQAITPLFSRVATITALHEQACPPPRNA